MEEGDPVLIIAHHFPFAVAEVAGPYNYIREPVPHLGVWFRHFRAVENVRYYAEHYTNARESLASAVDEQPRDEAWAVEKERQLRESFAAPERELPREALQSIECKSSLCELRVSSSVNAQELAALEEWVAWGQPCPYTMTSEVGPQQGAATLHVFLQCDE